MGMKDKKIKWYATRVVDNKPYVLKYLQLEGLETTQIADIPSLLFIRCFKKQLNELRYGDFRGYIYVYRKAGSNEPGPVPEHIMKTFAIMAPFHDEPVIYLSVDDPNFFKGQLKVVTGGVFKGCVGLVKRIKGERRLVVKVSDNSAVATPYIPREFIEDYIENK